MAQRRKVKKVNPKKNVRPVREQPVKVQQQKTPKTTVQPISMQPANPKPAAEAAGPLKGKNNAGLKKLRKTSEEGQTPVRGAGSNRPVQAKKQPGPVKAAASPVRKKAKPVKVSAVPPKRQTTKPSASPHRMFQLGLIPGKRRERNVKRMVVFSVVLVLAVSFVVYTLLSPTGPVENTVNQIAIWGSGKFPVKISGTQLKTVAPRAGQVFALTDTHILGINSGGRAFLEKQHGFSNPVLDVSGERVLVYNRESTGYSVLNNSKELYRGDLKNTIFRADICDSGVTAFVTACEGYAAQVSVYTKTMKLQFSWYLTEGFISDIALSNNGKLLAVAAVTVENGTYLTKIHVFSLKSETPLYTVELPGTAALSLEKISGSCFAAVTENDVHFVQWKSGTKTNGTDNAAAVSFIKHSPNGKIHVAVCGSSGAMTFYVYNQNGTLMHRFNYNENLTDFAVSNEYLYLLNNNCIQMRVPDGTLLNTAYTEGSQQLVAPCGSGVLAGDNSQLDYIRINKAAQSSGVSANN